MANVRLVEIA
jgi:hypothetical protein